MRERCAREKRVGRTVSAVTVQRVSCPRAHALVAFVCALRVSLSREVPCSRVARPVILGAPNLLIFDGELKQSYPEKDSNLRTLRVTVGSRPYWTEWLGMLSEQNATLSMHEASSTRRRTSHLKRPPPLVLCFFLADDFI